MAYFADGVAYVEAVARQASMPTLFDLIDAGGSSPEPVAEVIG
jgi:hypothetical protein